MMVMITLLLIVRMAIGPQIALGLAAIALNTPATTFGLVFGSPSIFPIRCHHDDDDDDQGHDDDHHHHSHEYGNHHIVYDIPQSLVARLWSSIKWLDVIFGRNHLVGHHFGGKRGTKYSLRSFPPGIVKVKRQQMDSRKTSSFWVFGVPVDLKFILKPQYKDHNRHLRQHNDDMYQTLQSST